MAYIDEIYRNLTGVDITTQKLLWDERGKGYYGEYLVFKELYPKLSGHCKILMNLQIPTGNGRTTEIDLLLIHETGLYVFEMKHYKGTIYGKSTDQRWTQYFRTAPNSHFYNPILQNQYHINALKSIFPNIPIYSFIVFTSQECSIRTQCFEQNISVCHINQFHLLLNPLIAQNKHLNICGIDDIFNRLLPFSPITSSKVTIEGESAPFYQYIHAIIKDFQTQKENITNAYLTAKNAEQKKTRCVIIFAIIAIILCIGISVVACFLYHTYANMQISAAEQTLNQFAQKFESVPAFNNGNLAFSDTLVTASKVVVEASSDIENTVLVSFVLTHTGKDYRVSINKETSITMILKDGTVKECKVFNEKYPYTSDVYLDSFSKSKTVNPHEFYDTSIDDIAYIKLTNVCVWTYVRHQRKTISTSYEVEIFKAD